MRSVKQSYEKLRNFRSFVLYAYLDPWIPVEKQKNIWPISAWADLMWQVHVVALVFCNIYLIYELIRVDILAFKDPGLCG